MGRSKVSQNKYSVIVVLLFFALIIGIFASYGIAAAFCSAVRKHIDSFYSIGLIMTHANRLGVLAKLGLILDDSFNNAKSDPSKWI